MRPLTPIVKYIIIFNCLLFGINEFGLYDLNIKFGQYYFGSPHFLPIQIFSSSFLHVDFQHLLFNMFSLYSIGTILENTWGEKRFFNFYLFCAFGSSLFHLLILGIIAHNTLGHFILTPEDIANGLEYFGGLTIGASGAVIGVFTAIAILYPNIEFTLFLIPFPIKAKYLFIFFVILDIFLGLMNYSWDNTAHFGHLGGAITGYILTKMNKNAKFNKYWK